MFNKVLIANRGEIALRIIAACKDLGLRTVAVYSVADKKSLHVQLADEAVCIGPASPMQSYLNVPNIISAAEITGADAIHPGYGFLAENADFAEICESCRIKFIGPSPLTIRTMGDKVASRQKAIKARVPVVPGSEKPLVDVVEGRKIAKVIGYPVVLKASAGGGGRGMRVVEHPNEFEKAFQTAQNEAARAFGNGDLYLEKYLFQPRHVEVQILGDEHGHVVHLFERDCSMQRRHQKVVEEAPCQFISPSTRRKLARAAVRLAEEVKYASAGTVEFLVDSQQNFYFIEMNTRVQVEHPVTEWITGHDIIRHQILIASGEKLNISQSDIEIHGHAIECRINAEDPETFIPSAGTVKNCYFPVFYGVRVDTALYDSYDIPPYYDSLIAKITAWGQTREDAIRRMVRALNMTRIEGIRTNIPLHLNLIQSEDFQKGKYHTQYLEDFIKQWMFSRAQLTAS